MEEDQDHRVTFRDWCIERGIPYREDLEEIGHILVRDEDMVAHYAELLIDFPGYFIREEDTNVPHAMN